MLKSFDLKQVELELNFKGNIRLSEKKDEFLGLHIFQNFQRQSISIQREYFSQTPCYFQVKNDFLIVSDNLADFSLNLSQISEQETVAYICKGSFTMPHSTFYKNIYTLPVGSFCEISLSEVLINYKKESFSKPSETLLELLRNSIEKYTAPYKRIASHVSGGLDSSGLSAVLATFFHEKKTHFCAVDTGYDTLSEKIYQNSFEKKFKEKISFYSSETHGQDFLYNYAKAFAQPANTITLPYLNINLLQRIKEMGYEALIMGNDGDDVLGHGYEYLDILIQNADIESLRVVLKNITNAEVLSVKYPIWNTFSEQKKYNLTVLFMLSRYRVSSGINIIAFFRICFRLLRGSEGLMTRLIQILRAKFVKKVKSDCFPASHQNTEVGTNTNHQILVNYKSKLGKVPPTAVFEANMISNHFYYNLSKLLGIKILSPFQDEGVLAYCENVPLKEKFGDGYGRAFYRKELSGILPDLIRDRIHKTTFDRWQIDAIKKLLIQSQKSDLSPLLFKFVKQSFVDDTFRSFQNAKDGSITQKSLSMLVYRIINVNIWLLSFSKNE